MHVPRASDPGAIVREFEGVSLGDRRLDARARSIVATLAASPTDSFPSQQASESGLEALYRFFSNSKVTMEKLLLGHTKATLERIRERPVVRLVHDSSAFKFSGDRDGLGVLLGNNMGFIGHVSLAVAGDETREPLGVLGLSTFVRKDAVAHRGLSNSERVKITNAKLRADRESSRWERHALATNALMPPGTRAIHVMDQEADDFVVLGELSRAGVDFVIRGSAERMTVEGLKVREVLEQKSAALFRTVPLSVRTKKPGGSLNKKRLPRLERDAQLDIRWGVVNFARSKNLKGGIDELSVNVVYVCEPSPPEGEQAVEWVLFTSEKVDTLEDATAVVDHYRSRWLIEEYFKSLKTGCAFEKRQLTSYGGLTRALGLFVPIAWHLLSLRHLARVEPTRKASDVFDREQLLLLVAMLRRIRYALPASPNVRDAMLGIAKLGGHIRNNGDPGWQVLGRGYTKFTEAEEVWRIARTSDQS